MKNLSLTLLSVFILFITSTKIVSAQSEETRSVSGFNRIVLEDPFTVHVKVDGTESLKIDASPDIIKLIQTTTKDGTLKIKYKDNLKNGEGNSDGEINIYVSARSLSAIVNSGTGSIKVDGNVTGKEVSIMLGGAGSIQASVKSENLNITNNGAGSILLDGNAAKAKVTISGAGSLKGHDLQTGDASVMIDGSGTAHLKADKTITADIAGSGDVFYWGNATLIGSHDTGSGKISKEN